MAYDQLVQSSAWKAAMRKTDLEAFAEAMRGDEEDPVTQAKNQATDAKPNAPGASSKRKPDTVHFCFRHFSGKCDLHERGKSCVFHHECPFCAETQEGCLVNHIRPLGLELIKTGDKHALEDRAGDKGGAKGGQPWSRGRGEEDRADGGRAERRRFCSRSRGFVPPQREY